MAGPGDTRLPTPAGQPTVASWPSSLPPGEPRSGQRPRFIAFYLPQYHPIPENDAWWGKGFTEWTSVTRARPLFRGHYQPHLPADLGFYDLRLHEVQVEQAELAAAYGIDAFCYYHYWFNGRRLLERPFAEVLRSRDITLPFCLCWANENWTRMWDGRSGEILLRQDYSADDDVRHARALLDAWSDPRYVRVDGRPLFLVYRASLLPDARRTTDVWRSEAAKAGLGDLFLCLVAAFHTEYGDPRELGFDAAVSFQPRWDLITYPVGRLVPRYLARRIGLLRGERALPRYHRMAYRELMERALAIPSELYRVFSGVATGWDNSPRRRREALIIDGASPDLYAGWLRRTCAKSDAGLVFITAWNEWGEGCHLEPDQRWGRAFLEAHASTVTELEAA